MLSIHPLSAAGLTLTLAACANEYEVNPLTQGAPPDASSVSLSSAPDPAATPEGPATSQPAGSAQPESSGYEPTDLTHSSSSATEAFVDQELGMRREVFELGDGVETSIADYLFVVDDSVSMENIIEHFTSGFAGLADGEAFPAKARIAVMNMVPARYSDLNSPHPTVKQTPGLRASPGFVHLVSTKRIDRFRRTTSEELAELFVDAGCDAWFSPDETNEDGTSCLISHTQISMAANMVEAGLTSFKQLLMRRTGRSTFRTGASVNVIFVSDTHEPGVQMEDPPERYRAALDKLAEERPDFTELATLVEADNTVTSFRVHAIAPKSQCSEGWEGLEPVYFQVAEASGGVSADICNLRDYAPVIRQIAETGSVMQQPVLALDSLPEDVEQVSVDGEAVNWWSGSDERALILEGAMPTSRSRVEVVYRPRSQRKANTKRR